MFPLRRMTELHVGQSTSVWMDATKKPEKKALMQDITADVCVVGAGIAGLSVAYELASEGKKVIVLNNRQIGGGQTERTTAHLACALDDRFMEVERIRGEEGSKLAAQSHKAAIDRIEEIVTKEKIECDFKRVDGYLFLPPKGSKQELKDELEAAHRAGLKEVEMLEKAPVKAFDTGTCLRFPNQGQFHPLKYLEGLSAAIEQKGGQIFTDTHVTSVKGGSEAEVKTQSGHTIRAKNVVVATNAPINDNAAIYSKQEPYLTYVIGAAIPKGSVETVLLWDTLDPYHYVRTQKLDEKTDVLIVGGEDHVSGQSNDMNRRFGMLESWTRARFPITDILYKWSGTVLETVDGLGLIGRKPMDEENVYIVTGDSGMGMTHGVIAGMLIRDLILGHKNAWEDLYNPARLPVKAAGEFAKAGMNVMSNISEYVTPGEVKTAEDIKLGEGAVIREGLKKIAVYKDEQGKTHSCSAVCAHRGCIVSWNGFEKTWDCPCHGSRYNAMGKVLNGPSMKDLAQL
jgi:glycine/D-amino acid oxidase-like deaminating enzyme/nitrite reductase/ring-hydroxylating ferredoxin subunit